jgi:tetratricopeptide (TPR) repeat protein
LRYYRNEPQEALNYYRQVREEARELGNTELEAIATGAMGRVRHVQGHSGEAEPLLSQAAEPLAQAANWTEWIPCVGFLGHCRALRGHYSEGLALGQRAVARALEANYLTGISSSQLVLGVIYLAGGDAARMLEASRAGLQATEQAADRLAAFVGQSFCAWAESRLGQHEAAMHSMDKANAFYQSCGGRGVHLGDWFAAIRAEVALNAGRYEEALDLARQAVSCAQSIEGLFAEGLAQRTWGQALTAVHPPRYDEAEAHMAASLLAFETGECWVEAARTRLAWGRICADNRDHATALDHFCRAAAQFEAFGLGHELELTRQWSQECR